MGDILVLFDDLFYFFSGRLQRPDTNSEDAMGLAAFRAMTIPVIGRICQSAIMSMGPIYSNRKR
jgi:hypothetical protein